MPSQRKKTSADALDGNSPDNRQNALTKKGSLANLKEPKNRQRSRKSCPQRSQRLRAGRTIWSQPRTPARNLPKGEQSLFRARMHLKRKTFVPSRKRNTAPRNWIRGLPEADVPSNTSIERSTNAREEKRRHDSFRGIKNAFITCQCQFNSFHSSLPSSWPSA